ncbi:MAG: hypothetical protein FJ005_05655 [Chloroflexi bacterium]|nr:hypothetical protein [Chloroflexota bacterium]
MSQIKEPAEVEIKVGLSIKDVITALRGLNDEDREFFIENLLAATSPEYLESIRQARKDYKEGKTVPFKEALKG